MASVSFCILIFCSVVALLGGCASLPARELVLARVDGEPITEGDLKYALGITHRKEDLSSPKDLNLSIYLDKLIDDRLIVQEATRMGLENDPEVKQALKDYILRESVVRLREEEIVRKVTVTEEEILSYYKKNYERYSIGLIETSTGEEAYEILEEVKRGADFKELARNRSIHQSKKDGGELNLPWSSMPAFISETVSNLGPEEHSSVINAQNRYFIVKLIGRKEASAEELEGVRSRIEKTLRKQKEEERSGEYLKQLREQANPKIDSALLEEIKLDGKESIDNWSRDERTLAQVYDSILTVKEFVSLPSSLKSKENSLNSWIDFKLVDYEALSRKYETKSGLQEMVSTYKNQLLKSIFIKKIILPSIVVTDKTLTDYYLSNQKNYVKPSAYRIQQITVKTREEAEEALNNLRNGAHFAWLARKRSVDQAASVGGDAGWISKPELPKPLRVVVETLQPGDVSPIMEVDSQYRIMRIQGKTEETPEEFSKVKEAVSKAYFNEQVVTLLNQYISKLKPEAQIKIEAEALQSLEEKLKR